MFFHKISCNLEFSLRNQYLLSRFPITYQKDRRAIFRIRIPFEIQENRTSSCYRNMSSEILLFRLLAILNS